MNTNARISALLLAALVIGGVVYTASASPDENQIAPQAGPKAQAARRLIAQRYWFMARWLLAKGEPATITGEVVAQTPGITVVQVDGKNLNILTPRKWLVNGAVQTSAELMDSLHGKTVTMETLKVEHNSGVKTMIYAVYKITSEGITAEPIIGANISPAIPNA